MTEPAVTQLTPVRTRRAHHGVISHHHRPDGVSGHPATWGVHAGSAGASEVRARRRAERREGPARAGDCRGALRVIEDGGGGLVASRVL